MTVIERAIAHLEETASELRYAHCLGADWLGEHAAKALHDDLLDVVKGLRGLEGEA